MSKATMPGPTFNSLYYNQGMVEFLALLNNSLVREKLRLTNKGEKLTLISKSSCHCRGMINT